ncbi:MAG: PilZ domain-containing protein [Pyrinomonadaceae bacterium]
MSQITSPAIEMESPNDASPVRAKIQFKLKGKAVNETSVLASISRSGCSVVLSHQFEAGRLLKLVMPLPDEFRAYDLGKKQYTVIGLVQNCYEFNGDAEEGYRVGVAFVGKSFPASYKTDPQQSYHICGTTPSGMWKVTESGKEFKVRNAPRFWSTLGVSITMVEKEQRKRHLEQTVTLNISSAGASIISTFKVKAGDRLKFASKSFDFYAIAIVRNSKIIDDHYSSVSIEFVDARFPVERLSVRQVTAITDQNGDKYPRAVRTTADVEKQSRFPPNLELQRKR